MPTPTQQVVFQVYFDLTVFLCAGGLLVLAAWLRRTDRSLFGSTPRRLLNLLVWTIIGGLYVQNFVASPELLGAGGPVMSAVRIANLALLATTVVLLAISWWRGRTDDASDGSAESASA